NNEYSIKDVTNNEVVTRLNASAASVYALCDGRRSIEEVVDLLVERFPGDASAIRAQVPKTIKALEDRGFLRRQV
ncbi:MAG: PqqD family protein, partial [Proteobacteria bacterium]